MMELLSLAIETDNAVTNVVDQDHEPELTDEELLTQFLESLSDEEVHGFLNQQLSEASDEEGGEGNEVWKMEQQEESLKQRVRSSDVTLCCGERCGEVKISCVSCKRTECGGCLIKGHGWLMIEVLNPNWVCVICDEGA